MKVRRRYSTSSGESEESAASADSDTDQSSASAASESASSGHTRERRDKKHKRRAPTSDSDSEEETRRRAKKHKHKKKKKKHAKKRRREASASDDEESSESDGEGAARRAAGKKSRRHKHDKHKHKKSASRSPSVQEVPVVHLEREEYKERAGGAGGRAARLQSVVGGGRRHSSSPRHDPSRSRSPQLHRYYEQDERKYERSASVEYEERPRDNELERFYRGSSKERSLHSEQHPYRHQSTSIPRYEEQEKYERFGGGREYGNGAAELHNARSRRSREPQDYSHRPVKYEQEEFDIEARPRDDARYRDRSQRDREYHPRQHSFSQHDDRTRHHDKAGPVCLVCGEGHAGRACRAAPPRFRDPDRDFARSDRNVDNVDSTEMSNEFVLQLERYFSMCTLRPDRARSV